MRHFLAMRGTCAPTSPTGKRCWRLLTAASSPPETALPENIPGHGDAFHPAVPITLETVAGNTITLDLGGGQFAYYMHLQAGSLQRKNWGSEYGGARCWRASALPATPANRICILKSQLPRSCWLARACLISSTDTAAKPRVTGLRNSTHTSCHWTKVSSDSRKSGPNDDANALTTVGSWSSHVQTGSYSGPICATRRVLKSSARASQLNLQSLNQLSDFLQLWFLLFW